MSFSVLKLEPSRLLSDLGNLGHQQTVIPTVAPRPRLTFALCAVDLLKGSAVTHIILVLKCFSLS